MSHARKDTLVAAKTPHRGPHLTKEAKRRTAKAERQAAKALVNKVEEQKPEGLGLHNDPERMRWMRENQGSSVIPTGIYCYDKKPCPYWDMAENEEKQCNGFCWFLMKGDWHPDIGELWDQCKCCGMREEVVPEGTILVVDERAET